MKKSLNRRITIYFLIILALMTAVSVAWNYFSTRQSIIDMEKTQSQGCSEAITVLLQHYGENLDKDRTTAEYLFLRNAVDNLCKGFSQDAIYLYTVEPGTGNRPLLMAVEREGNDPTAAGGEPDGFPLPTAQLEKAEEALAAGDRPQRIEMSRNSGWRVLWLDRLLDTGIQTPVYLAMDYNATQEYGHIIRDFLADILIPSIMMGTAFLILNLMIRRRVSRPIRVISDRMKQFAQHSSILPAPLNIHHQDEIGEIASSFETMTGKITAYIGNIEKLTKESVENEVQMDIARRIQNGLVPESYAMNGATFRISAMTRPAKAVGGDFYDCFRRDDGSICFLMGDVSGKGITGAIMMAVIKTVLREKLALGLTPAQALNQANAQMIDQNPEGFFVTVFAAVLDPRTGNLLYANAGHTWPVLLGEGAVILKPETGIALGLFDDAEIRDETMNLAPGRGILLYTDGLTDTLDAKREPFGLNRLMEVVKDAPDGSDPAEEILRRIRDRLNAYGEGVEAFDDTTALALWMTDAKPEEQARPRREKRDGPPRQEETLSLPVALSSFAAVREAVTALAGDTPETRKMLLACDEALTNIVKHSGATKLLFRCERREDTLRVVFADNGIPFDPRTAETEEKPFEELDSGGMGLNLIRQTVSATAYERTDGMNRFTLYFSIMSDVN